jgi:hypothetical protein
MRLLESHIGHALSDIIGEGSSDDEQLFARQRATPHSPTIVWAAEVCGKRLFLAKEGVRLRLIVVINFLNRPEYEGVQAVADALLKEGIMETSAAIAHASLPPEVREQIRIMRVAQSTDLALTPGMREGHQLRFNW